MVLSLFLPCLGVSCDSSYLPRGEPKFYPSVSAMSLYKCALTSYTRICLGFFFSLIVDILGSYGFTTSFITTLLRPISLFSSDERSKLLLDWASATECFEQLSLCWMLGLTLELLFPMDVAILLWVPFKFPYKLCDETLPSLVIIRCCTIAIG